MTKRNLQVISSRRYFYESMRVMKFRTLLLLFGTIPFFTAFNAQGNGIVSLNDVNHLELIAPGSNLINSTTFLADNSENNASVNDQQKLVTGRVSDSEGFALPGVNIMEKGTTNGVLSDAKGNFSLNVTSSNSVLIFTFIGFEPQEVSVGVQTTIDVVLHTGLTQISEVVVIGYGTQKKATVTGAIAAVESAKLLQSPVSNLSNAMVGRVSGLLSTQASGAPGQDQTTLRIRGIGTFAGTADPLVMIDGIQAQNYNNIDPNEIENISILKDASATAVYGVRGANGVLLITTKRGKLGKPQVTYTGQTAVSSFANIRQYLGSYEYALGYNEALRYDSYLTGVYTPKYTDTDIQYFKDGTDPLFHPNTDWIDLMFKPYTRQSQHNLNISGGTEAVKYFISVGYFGQGGLYNEDAYDPGYDAQNKYNRYNFRSNFDFKISNRLSAKVNISSQIEDTKGTAGSLGASTNNSGYMMSNIFATPPTMSPGVWDGKIVNIVTTAYYMNPLPQVFGNGMIRNYNNYLNGTVRFNYDLDFVLKGLSTHIQASYQVFNSNQINYPKTLVQYYAINLGNGNYQLAPQNPDSPFGYNESYGKRRRNDLEFGFDYSRTFGVHNVGGLLLYTQNKTYDPNLTYVVPNGYQGVVGRVTYDFDKRYLAEFDFGYNGTENFAPGKRFGFFPAYSLGWVVSEENFFPKSKVVSFIKLRGSYGEVGNDKIGGTRFLYRPTSYVYSGQYRFGEVPATFNAYNRSNEGLIGNPDLTWERAKKLDIGIDLTVFADKVRITADFFSEKRDNILATKGTTPEMIGATLPPYNLGKMKNNGWDGDITYNGKISRLNFWMKGIVTITHNVIEFQDEVLRPWEYQYRTGQRYGQTFGYVAEGIYNTWEEVSDANRPRSSHNSNKIQPGDFRYKDINGDGLIDSFDQVPLGYSAFPEQSYGLSFGGDFNGLDISVLFQSAGNYTHSASKKFSRGWQEDGSAVSYLVERSWTWEKYQAGIETDFPHTSSSSSQAHNFAANSFWLEDSRYVRLKNIELGYTLSPRLLKDLGIESVRFYVTGNNIYTWHKLFPGEDPEIPTYGDSNNEPYPITKTFNGGITVKF